jgi:hypothetical protein
MNMINRKPLKKAIIATAIMAVALTVFSFAPVSFAQLISPNDAPSLVQSQTGGEGDIKELAKTILNFVLTFLGFIAVAFIIYGGFLYVGSGGNDENTGKAKKIIINAIIGIIIIFASYAIVNTVLRAPQGSGAAVTTSQ